MFVNREHAQRTVDRGDRQVPCEDCMRQNANTPPAETSDGWDCPHPAQSTPAPHRFAGRGFWGVSTKKECQSCASWVRDHEDGEGMPTGTCHRYPPAPGKVNADEWPCTLESEWCGEWTEDPSPQVKPKSTLAHATEAKFAVFRAQDTCPDDAELRELLAEARACLEAADRRIQAMLWCGQ
jgi:hypothetical protein